MKEKDIRRRLGKKAREQWGEKHGRPLDKDRKYHVPMYTCQMTIHNKMCLFQCFIYSQMFFSHLHYMKASQHPFMLRQVWLLNRKCDDSLLWWVEQLSTWLFVGSAYNIRYLHFSQSPWLAAEDCCSAVLNVTRSSAYIKLTPAVIKWF